VKLEVDASFAPLVARMSRAGLPIVAHIGSRPQQVRRTGGYKAAGKTAAEARDLVATAKQMVEAGAVMLLIEATAAVVTDEILQSVDIPVIGCGAGPACDGHVVVLHDLLGMSDWQPAFARPITDIGERLAGAAKAWRQLIASGEYLRDDHPYKMSDEERRKFEERD
jgi:3-methyl-2-oxobutanoate hydroxymethyltransferase